MSVLVVQGNPSYNPTFPCRPTPNTLCLHVNMLHSACTENMNETWMQAGYTVLLIAYRHHIYTTIHLGNWFPLPDPIESRFFSIDGHQLSHNETLICNTMMIFMTLDQIANEKNIKLVLCKFIQSRRPEMARDTGSWITMNHVHTACIAHTVYSWLHGRSLCTTRVPIIMYSRLHVRGEFPFKTLCRQSSLFMGSGVSCYIFQFQVASIIIWKWWNMAHV